MIEWLFNFVSFVMVVAATATASLNTEFMVNVDQK